MAERLKEQINPQYLPLRRRRASAIHATQTAAHPPASPHYAGNHPEGAPYMTQGPSRRTMQPGEDDEEEEYDALYPQRPSTSARRYLPPREEVYRQGHRQIVVHREPPPKKYSGHWILLVVMGIMVLGWMSLSALGGWWQIKQDDWKYGNPRTFQIDQYVGHADSLDHPNHFIAINLKGIIEVVEINTQIPKDDHIYAITTASDGATPVSLAFADTNHDGKVDMLVTIGDSNPYTVILLNTGSVFQR